MDMTYLLQEPPELSKSEVTNSVQEYYGLEGTLHALPGDRDQNFLLESKHRPGTAELRPGGS